MAYPFATRATSCSKSGGLGLQLYCDDTIFPGARVDGVKGNAQSTNAFQVGDHIVEVDGAKVLDLSYAEVISKLMNAGETVSFVLASGEIVDRFLKANNWSPSGQGQGQAHGGPRQEASVNDILSASGAPAQIANDVSVSDYLAGAGETDKLANAIRNKLYDATVPFTTRPMRPGEIDGQTYNFVSRETFDGYIRDDKLLEHGEHNGNHYGTMKLDQQEMRRAITTAGTSPGTTAAADEATISHLFSFLEKNGKEAYKVGYAEDKGEMTISGFLRAVISSTDKQDLATRGVVRDAVYDYTCPITTRPMKAKEQQGREYVFVSREDFDQLVREERMLEWGERNSGWCYGTPKMFSSDLEKAEREAFAEQSRGIARRNTLVEAVANGPKEATLASLLEHIPEIAATEAAQSRTPSEFLQTMNSAGGELGAVRQNLLAAIYDITVPLTTRPARPGETHGKEYNFVTSEQFTAFVEKGSMLEFGERNGVFYGTLKVSDEELVQYKSGKSTPEASPAKPAEAPAPTQTQAPTMWDESSEL